MTSFVSFLRDEYKKWLSGHREPPGRDAAITHLIKTHKDIYAENQNEINRQWTGMLILGGWARKVPKLPKSRQLCFDYGEQAVPCEIPESVRVGNSEFPLLRGKRKDWVEYLRAIGKHRLTMHRFFDLILDPIFGEHDGIDASAAIEIAIERGKLREWREDDDSGETTRKASRA